MAFVLNILVPGAGLIVRRREWLGLALALLFGVATNVALAGWLVAPAAIPGRYAWGASGLAVLSWAAAQVLLARQSRSLVHQAHAVEAILRRAADCRQSGDVSAAREALDSAVDLDPEHLAAHVERARFLTESSDIDAPAAWRRVARLDTAGRFRQEAKSALGRAG